MEKRELEKKNLLVTSRKGDNMKFTELIVGILALIGALMVGSWAYNRYVANRAATTGALALYSGAAAGSVPPPCVAPQLSQVASVSACGCPNANAAVMAVDPYGQSRSDLFPSSYVTFGFERSGCLGDPRNKRS